VLDAARLALRQGGRAVTVTVDSQDPVLRRLVGFIPGWAGIRRLDARQELELARLRPVQALYGTTGWPSVCLLGRRDWPRIACGPSSVRRILGRGLLTCPPSCGARSAGPRQGDGRASPLTVDTPESRSTSAIRPAPGSVVRT